MPWKPQRDTAPPQPAEACPEHTRALELSRQALNLETIANNPELAFPECDNPKELDRIHDEYYAQVYAVETKLTTHLIKHRAVLSRYREWRHHYADIDAKAAEEAAENETREQYPPHSGHPDHDRGNRKNQENQSTGPGQNRQNSAQKPRRPECARLPSGLDQDHPLMPITNLFQAPPLTNEPQLLRTLERVCHQHGATDTTTHQLIADVVTSVRVATDLKQVLGTLKNYETGNSTEPEDLTTLLSFVRRALDAAELHATTGDYAGPAELAPEIRHAIAHIIDLIWEREADDYNQQDRNDHVDHPHLHLTALHNWLGPYSPIR
ncbi:hypothetical protein [Nocardia carnea]|uniref:hypothetical protein n=1 Tax=Nocardia carnea TaxID=37328 RepID=UPI00245905CB|nr:hypothetical protein [Nocardia carnea]